MNIEALLVSENQYMATLLRNSALAVKYINKIQPDTWQLNANKWLWKQAQEHYKNVGQLPTFEALQNYAKVNGAWDVEKLSKESALAALDAYKDMELLAPDYCDRTILPMLRDTIIKESILQSCETQNWLVLRDTIIKAYNNTNALPERTNLKELVTKPSNDHQNLLNEWAFERQAILALVAPTGFGKSVMTMQLATHFACGKETIGFKPHKQNRVLVIQNEDSENDIASMRDGALSLLNEREQELVYQNLFFVRLRGMSGKEFIQALDFYCSQFDTDIIFVNPLLKYFGGDPLNTREVSDFLNELEPLLERHNCGLILVHHTIKQGASSRKNQVDSAYAGFGSAVWSNSVRDTVEIRLSQSEGYYKLITGKRSSKWGWKERFIKRNEIATLPCWHDVDKNTIASLLKSEKNSVSNGNIEKVFTALATIPDTMTIPEIMAATELSERSIRTHIKTLLDEKRIAVADCSDNENKKRYYKWKNN